MLSVLGVRGGRKGEHAVALLGRHAGAGCAACERQALVAADLRSENRRAEAVVSRSRHRHSACNDIAIDKDGTAYATDTPNGRIFRVKPGSLDARSAILQDDQLKGIDGIVFSGDGTLYVNIVSRGALIRVDRKADGSAGALTELTLSRADQGAGRLPAHRRQPFPAGRGPGRSRRRGHHRAATARKSAC